MTAEQLRSDIRHSLEDQGFSVTDARILPPVDASKEIIRSLHRTAVVHRIEEATRSLCPLESRLIENIANGADLDVYGFDPYLEVVESGADSELLFRYVSLHWSIPVSSGYGRRLRFLIKDRGNGKLVGVLGLCDPVISLGGRDRWIGWGTEQRFERLRHVMDAFVVGAVPPYSHLLCGKLVALLSTSEIVRKAFHKKYAGTTARISGREFDGRLALVTTMSALGRSSIYNRLSYNGDLVFEPVGFSRGTGEFHFSNGLYAKIAKYAHRYCTPTYRREEWGDGFRNRREVIRKCLRKIHLSVGWSHHGIEREVFVAPFAANTREFLRGEHERLRWFKRDEQALIDWFKQRWFIPRSCREMTFRQFEREQYRIWPRTGNI